MLLTIGIERSATGEDCRILFAYQHVRISVPTHGILFVLTGVHARVIVAGPGVTRMGLVVPVSVRIRRVGILEVHTTAHHPMVTVMQSANGVAIRAGLSVEAFVITWTIDRSITKHLLGRRIGSCSTNKVM